MKFFITILFLTIALASFGQKKLQGVPESKIKYTDAKDSKIIDLSFNNVEWQIVSKQYRIIDSIQANINDRWRHKLNDRGYKESQITEVLPTKRDSLKLKVKK